MNPEPDFQAELDALPKGTIIRRTIRGTDRYYHQWREDGLTKSRYLAPGDIAPFRAQLDRRKYLQTLLRTSSTQALKHASSLTFRCDVLTGRFLDEYAAGVTGLKPRDAFADLLAVLTEHPDTVSSSNSNTQTPKHADTLTYPTNSNTQTPKHLNTIPIPPFLLGPQSAGKTTLLRQLVAALAPTLRAKAAYIRLTGKESVADLTADLSLLRDLGFRHVFIDDAEALDGLPGAGLTLLLAGTVLPAALWNKVTVHDLSFIPFRELHRLTGETEVDALLTRGGTLAPPGEYLQALKHSHLPDQLKHSNTDSDRFVLDVLALAALRARDEARAHGEAFLGTDLQKLRTRFAELSGLAGDEDPLAREALLDRPLHLRYAHACARLAALTNDPVLDRLGAAERKIVRDLLLEETRFRLLEDAIWNELRHAAGRLVVHRIPFAPGAYGFIVADEEELTCEVLVLSTDAVRSPLHLRYLDDPARLDAIEHRYGMITDRTVLYNGRDARLASGVSYRNLLKYLIRKT